ncbi:MAG: deoxyhypusine synthase family protein [Planctomycetes bacterium]|nr:deoxyhypusine synthase family protein [Planctomycetota bacterium]
MSPTRKDQNARCLGPGASSANGGGELKHRPVTEVEGLDQLFEQSLPSFGGAYLRRVWVLLDEAVGKGLPMTLSIAGPVTVSGQHYAWLNPLLDTGWFAYLSTTDAVCYHDGHRALNGARKNPFTEVPIFGDDGALRDEKTIRVTDIGFPEDVLLEQDQFVTACLREPEFQRRMTGTEFRNLLGARYAAQERANGVAEGLLALCRRKSIPIFVGAPGDGSVFLNSVKLWALARLGSGEHAFDLDLHAEVFESCAYHLWGLRDSPTKALGTLILGGGVPKNYNLQPEPALSQIFGLPEISGYLYDVQITTAPITDGSLSSCPPAEAVTWGKVDEEHYRSTCESLSADYSMVMPFVVKALLDKRARYERWAERMGKDALFAKHPEARGYLREREGYRLFARRDELVKKLLAEVAREKARLAKETRYPLAATEPTRAASAKNAPKPAAKKKTTAPKTGARK